MNRTILIGNLAKDPENRVISNGSSCTMFTLAVNRPYKNKQTGNRDADFFPVVTWNGTADICARYLAKGRKVAVAGRLQTRSYDAQDGTRRYVTEIVADEVELLGGGPNRGDAYEPEEYQSAPSAQDGYMEQCEIDELPF